MRNPTKVQLQKVISRFKTILPYAQENFQLDMKEFYVTISFKECKTIHCVGG